MDPIEMQVGMSYTLPAYTRLVVKEAGTGTRYSMLIHDNATQLDQKLKGKSELTYRMFYYLITHMKPMSNNITYVHLDSLCEYFALSSKSIYKAIKQLMNVDILRRIKKGHYLVNPHIVWCGHTGKRIEAVLAWDSRITEASDNEESY